MITSIRNAVRIFDLVQIFLQDKNMSTYSLQHVYIIYIRKQHGQKKAKQPKKKY